MKVMKAFWNDCGRGPSSDSPIDVDLGQAQDIWSDGRGVKGNFFGLVDEQGNTIQFYLDTGIPDGVEDARHLRIVIADFPVQKERGSYSKVVSIGEVSGMIATAFQLGASHLSFSGLSFSAW